jgi:hypothetical protein
MDGKEVRQIEPLGLLKQRQNLQISLTEESASCVWHPGERYLIRWPFLRTVVSVLDVAVPSRR